LEIICNPSIYSSDSPTFALRDLPVVTPDYRQLLRDTLTIGTYSEMIHLFALSKALGVPVQSYCPPTTSTVHPYTIYVYQSAFERTFRPGTVTLMWTSSSVTAPEPNHIVLLVPCQPSTGLFPLNGHPLEDCTAEEPMDELTIEPELTVAPDAKESKRKRNRRQKRAIHADELTAAADDEEPEPSKRKRRRKRAVQVSSRQDDSNIRVRRGSSASRQRVQARRARAH